MIGDCVSFGERPSLHYALVLDCCEGRFTHTLILPILD